MNPSTKLRLGPPPSLLNTGNAAFDGLVEASQKFDRQVEEVLNSRLHEAFQVSQSPAHWNRWVMEMGSGRMVEVSK